MECLKDPDVSIRQRALELTYQLVNSDNVTELVREILNYLVVCASEHKAILCSRVHSGAQHTSCYIFKGDKHIGCHCYRKVSTLPQ